MPPITAIGNADATRFGRGTFGSAVLPRVATAEMIGFGCRPSVRALRAMG